MACNTQGAHGPHSKVGKSTPKSRPRLSFGSFRPHQCNGSIQNLRFRGAIDSMGLLVTIGPPNPATKVWLMTVSLLELWLPILLSAVLIFLASSVLHMVLPLHKKDFQKLPGEAAIADAIRAQNVAPGDYVFPCPQSMQEMASPEIMEQYQQGPVGFVTLMPVGPPAIGKSLIQWFLYTIVVTVLVGYLATIANKPAGANFAEIFRFTMTAAFVCYGFSYAPNSIWKGSSWSSTARFVFDGLIYSCLTGAAFGWLWPAAS